MDGYNIRQEVLMWLIGVDKQKRKGKEVFFYVTKFAFRSIPDVTRYHLNNDNINT